MKIINISRKHLLTIALVLFAAPVVLYILAVIYVTQPFATHPNHDKERATMQADYDTFRFPSSLQLMNSKWTDDSAPPEDPQNYGWSYTYKPTLQRTNEYRELQASFAAQGFKPPQGYDSIPNSILYGYDVIHHLQLAALFLPQPDQAHAEEPLASVRIDVDPLPLKYK
jgi:hypothetical protein